MEDKKHGEEQLCTLEKRGNLFFLTLTGAGEHRLNPNLISSLRSALSRLQSDPSASSSSALITTAQGNFFSNGFDLDWAQSSELRLQLMSSSLRSLVHDLICLPMPTIAAVTGHASAAGMMLALSHDYVVMRRDRGFLYMSEMDIGLVVTNWFMVLMRSKIGDPRARREAVMRAAKLTAEDGVRMGIVDSAHDGVEATVAAAVELGEALVARKWDGHVYGENLRVVLREVLEAVGYDEAVEEVADKARSKL
ncbi:enoyl-CoA delta isomerase 1, peroxisomal-like [Rhodamnia argentea]|uniref:Delta(3)-Delta(2)-enoyl-CoA isomerase n=1 Tax=Rhodamnia argentea TaxID=178133 RepID=A0A8B8MRA9_9MYRT|nr:enoyl-CoA delta isomerase 1, peroxisomal-like [Rhodamnia argentea]